MQSFKYFSSIFLIPFKVLPLKCNTLSALLPIPGKISFYLLSHVRNLQHFFLDFFHSDKSSPFQSKFRPVIPISKSHNYTLLLCWNFWVPLKHPCLIACCLLYCICSCICCDFGTLQPLVDHWNSVGKYSTGYL